MFLLTLGDKSRYAWMCIIHDELCQAGRVEQDVGSVNINKWDVIDDTREIADTDCFRPRAR